MNASETDRKSMSMFWLQVHVLILVMKSRWNEKAQDSEQKGRSFGAQIKKYGYDAFKKVQLKNH